VPFGTIAQAEHELVRVRVAPGDLLVVYTDGVTEAVNETGEEYGIDRLSQFVRDTHGSAVDFEHRLFDSIDIFAAGSRQHDDITCLTAQFSR
jgi:sigma-B regulation protein RsbU (phosphoserine phosphatase)